MIGSGSSGSGSSGSSGSSGLKRQWIDDGLVEVGLDEVGRGSFWGRLYVGAVILSPEDESYFDNGAALRQIKDSKKLSRRLRAILADYINETAIEAVTAWSEPEEIDSINIFQADMAAMHRALATLQTPFQRILVDGDRWNPYTDTSSCETVPAITIIEGDKVSLTIAAASIIAKEAHDQWVKDMIEAEPDLHTRYGLGTNMGYGTATHRAGLETWGPHALHRRSFAPVRALCAPDATLGKPSRPLFKT